MFTLSLCFGGWYLGLLVVPIWILAELYGGWVAAKPAHPARWLYAALALVDLVVPACLLLVVPVAQLLRLGCGTVAGLLTIKLLLRTPFPDWFLPVRGRHARRLLAALSILGLLGAGPLGFLGVMAAEGHPDVRTTPWWAWLWLVGLLFYLAPLWSVLVDGWDPEAEAATAVGT